MVSGLAVGLPVEERPYHQFWRSPWNAWWRPVVAVLLGGIGFVTLALVFGMIALIADPPPRLDPRSITLTPVMFLANNLSLAALIPLSIALSVAFLRQPAGYLASVAGRIRWRLLFKVAALLTPIWIMQQAFTVWVTWDETELAIRPHTVAMAVIILTTQVFQCAGEEYGFRGLVNRGVGGLIGHEHVSFLVSAMVSSLFFTVVHNAQDPWLNLFYFVFGMVACYLTWRTGGLEAAIALHCVNNLIAMTFVPFSDMSGLFDRGEGTGSALILVNVGFLLVGAWVAIRFTKSETLVVRTAPGRELIAALRRPPAQPWPPQAPVGSWASQALPCAQPWAHPGPLHYPGGAPVPPYGPPVPPCGSPAPPYGPPPQPPRGDFPAPVAPGGVEGSPGTLAPPVAAGPPDDTPRPARG